MNPIDQTVFPSEEKTIFVEQDDYAGAHRYRFTNCLGFENGKTKYDDSKQVIQFVHKQFDGTITAGVQSEQLVLALIDRHEKLDKMYPCEENKVAIAGLRQFIQAQKDRVQNRINRGVMGDLKK